jgi:putative intracellular protease/amidase/mannose-6-phosphate isomerase-like protein (cupin superfamily)
VTSQKLLFALSSHGELGNTGRPTGYYVPEAAYPWKVVTQAGFEVDFVSPQGGATPAIGLNFQDSVQREFLENAEVVDALHNTLSPGDLDPGAYVAIHYVGGHGAMWDFADDEQLALLAVAIYEAGGAISAVCHGSSGLVNMKLSDGCYLVEGRDLACFTDDEERAVGLSDVVPYKLETKLKERGAKSRKATNFEPNVVVDGRLVTGQNPKSAAPMAQALVGVLRKCKPVGGAHPCLPELPDPADPTPLASQRVVRRLRIDVEETENRREVVPLGLGSGDLSYLDRLIDKPWGSEYRVYEDDLRDAWCLHIGPHQRTSLHCHPRKLTALLCLEGDGSLTTCAGTEIALQTGTVLQIEPGAYHRSAVGSRRGLRLVEIETPKDKFDLLRMADDYERTAKPYEGERDAAPTPDEYVEAVALALHPLVEQTVGNHSARLRAQCSTGRYRFALETGQQVSRQSLPLIFAIALDPRASPVREVTVVGPELIANIDADADAPYLTIRIAL